MGLKSFIRNLMVFISMIVFMGIGVDSAFAESDITPGGPWITDNQNISLKRLNDYPQLVKRLKQIEKTSKGLIELEPRNAPALRLQDLDGRVFDLTEARGRWAVVHFWASWCGPCRREMPTVERMAKALADKPVKIVLVNTAENEDAVFSFMSVVAPGLNTLMDHDGSVTERWQPRGLPSTFLVDPDSRLRFVALGIVVDVIVRQLEGIQ